MSSDLADGNLSNISGEKNELTLLMDIQLKADYFYFNIDQGTEAVKLMYDTLRQYWRYLKPFLNKEDSKKLDNLFKKFTEETTTEFRKQKNNNIIFQNTGMHRTTTVRWEYKQAMNDVYDELTCLKHKYNLGMPTENKEEIRT